MVIVDVETSGIDTAKHSILSIGAVDFHHPHQTFYGECRAWEGAHIWDEALAVNGFTEEEATDPKKQSVEELAVEFKKWMDERQEKTLVGQNPAFDRDFVNDSFARAGINWRFAARTIDLHAVAYVSYLQNNITIPFKNNHSGIKLDTILEYVGIPEEPKPHNALTGAKVEAEALSRLVYGKNLLEEFKKFPVSKHLLRK